VITETGRVLAVEEGYLWVATIQTSTCNSCKAQVGCGQRLMAKLGQDEALLKVGLGDYPAKAVSVNDQVVLGIAEEAVVKASMLAYMLPLLLMLLAVLAAQQWLAPNFGEPAVILSAIIGLAAGALIIYWHGRSSSYQEQYQPILLDHHLAVAA